jgi:hypothetical protein
MRGLGLTLAAAAAAMATACGTGAPHPTSDDTRHPATSTVAAIPVGSLAPTAVPPPDADGNPACPASDVWGKSPTGKGIVVTYWATGSDVVTVLVRGRSGDVAKTAVINPEDRFRMFEFDDTDAAAVDRVVIMSNTVRCYARPDPGTAPR